MKISKNLVAAYNILATGSILF